MDRNWGASSLDLNTSLTMRLASCQSSACWRDQMSFQSGAAEEVLPAADSCLFYPPAN
jgi:hypothetical protein